MFGAFAMDTILQVAFGTKVDSLKDPDNKIVKMAKKIFQSDITLSTMIMFAMFFLFPKFAFKLMKLFNINQDFVIFFKEFSIEIIRKKRAELKNNKNTGKATNFLEMLLEAEDEHEQMLAKENSGTNAIKDNNENSKLIKCK